MYAAVFVQTYDIARLPFRYDFFYIKTFRKLLKPQIMICMKMSSKRKINLSISVFQQIGLQHLVSHVVIDASTAVDKNISRFVSFDMDRITLTNIKKNDVCFVKGCSVCLPYSCRNCNNKCQRDKYLFELSSFYMHLKILRNTEKHESID